jgi:hypothetical protein
MRLCPFVMLLAYLLCGNHNSAHTCIAMYSSPGTNRVMVQVDEVGEPREENMIAKGDLGYPCPFGRETHPCDMHPSAASAVHDVAGSTFWAGKPAAPGLGCSPGEPIAYEDTPAEEQVALNRTLDMLHAKREAFRGIYALDGQLSRRCGAHCTVQFATRIHDGAPVAIKFFR